MKASPRITDIQKGKKRIDMSKITEARILIVIFLYYSPASFDASPI